MVAYVVNFSFAHTPFFIHNYPFLLKFEFLWRLKAKINRLIPVVDCSIIFVHRTKARKFRK